MASSHREALSDARHRLAQAQVRGDPSAIKRALKGIESARHALCHEADRAAEALIAALEDQNRLSERVMTGVIPAEEANRTNRHLSARIAEIRSKIAELNAILADEKPVEAAKTSKFAAPFWATPERAPQRRRLSGLIPTPQGFVVWLICMVLGVLIPLIYFGVIRFGSSVRVSVTEKSGMPGEYRVLFENSGRDMLQVAVPWVQNVGRGSGHVLQGYGLRVQMKDGDTFRTLPDEISMWTYLGAPLIEPIAVTVMPGAGAEFGLLTKTQGDAGTEQEQIRVLLVSEGGAIISRVQP